MLAVGWKTACWAGDVCGVFWLWAVLLCLQFNIHLLAWPLLGVPVCPLFAWLLLLCAGIRQAELSHDKTGFKWTKLCDGVGRRWQFPDLLSDLWSRWNFLCVTLPAPENRVSPRTVGGLWCPQPHWGTAVPLSALPKAAQGLSSSSTPMLVHSLGSGGIFSIKQVTTTVEMFFPFMFFWLLFCRSQSKSKGTRLQILPCKYCLGVWLAGLLLFYQLIPGVLRGQGAVLIRFWEADDSLSWFFRMLPFWFRFVAIEQRSLCVLHYRLLLMSSSCNLC